MPACQPKESIGEQVHGSALCEMTDWAQGLRGVTPVSLYMQPVVSIPRQLELHHHFAGLLIDGDTLIFCHQLFAGGHLKDATKKLHAVI